MASFVWSGIHKVRNKDKGHLYLLLLCISNYQGKEMVSIFCRTLPSPILPTVPSNNNSSFPYNLSGSVLCSSNKKDFSLSAAATSTFSPDIDLSGYSENELKARGVTFSGIGNDCVVKMALENGNSAKVMLPDGLITSFRAKMWHGGTVELLHTSVSQQENRVVVQGGLSLALCLEDDDGFSWSTNDWAFCQVKGNPQESIQVELISRNKEGNAEIKHIITLSEDHLTSEIIISNLSPSSYFRLMGSVISHLTLSTPEATYAVGLEGSDYFAKPPITGDFSIIPPKTTYQDYGKFWEFNKLFSKLNAKSQTTDSGKESLLTNEHEDLEGEEDDNYKHLQEELSRIYTSAPRNFTIIDRGRRNSIMVRRDGFNELYLFSPGSKHESYSKYSYICVGHSALLEPIILKAQGEWRGGLQLWNPNT